VLGPGRRSGCHCGPWHHDTASVAALPLAVAVAVWPVPGPRRHRDGVPQWVPVTPLSGPTRTRTHTARCGVPVHTEAHGTRMAHAPRALASESPTGTPQQPRCKLRLNDSDDTRRRAAATGSGTRHTPGRGAPGRAAGQSRPARGGGNCHYAGGHHDVRTQASYCASLRAVPACCGGWSCGVNPYYRPQAASELSQRY
jgi:hypothetical protein